MGGRLSIHAVVCPSHCSKKWINPSNRFIHQIAKAYKELGLLLVLIVVAILVYSSLVYFAERDNDVVGVNCTNWQEHADTLVTTLSMSIEYLTIDFQLLTNLASHPCHKWTFIGLNARFHFIHWKKYNDIFVSIKENLA